MGCLLGMLPLLFFKGIKDEKSDDKDQKKPEDDNSNNKDKKEPKSEK